MLNGRAFSGIEGVIWDWGDTLMRDIPGQSGPMVSWPHVEAMPGAAAALEAFSRMQVQCVGTNAEESDGGMVAEALARVGLEEHLTRFFTSGELGVRKPDPRFFEAIAEGLGLPPGRLVSIGNDLRKDILPAKEAGLATVLVAPCADVGLGEVVDLAVAHLTRLVDVLRESPGVFGSN